MTDITYILKMKNGTTRKLSVPDDWNLTYGQLVPFAKHNQQYDNGQQWVSGFGLRFYEGNKQTGKTRMVIGGVLEFWPEEIIMSEQVTETKRKHYGNDAPDGFKNTMVEARVVSWKTMSGDEEPNKFLEQFEDE